MGNHAQAINGLSGRVGKAEGHINTLYDQIKTVRTSAGEALTQAGRVQTTANEATTKATEALTLAQNASSSITTQASRIDSVVRTQGDQAQQLINQGIQIGEVGGKANEALTTANKVSDIAGQTEKTVRQNSADIISLNGGLNDTRRVVSEQIPKNIQETAAQVLSFTAELNDKRYATKDELEELKSRPPSTLVNSPSSSFEFAEVIEEIEGKIEELKRTTSKESISPTFSEPEVLADIKLTEIPEVPSNIIETTDEVPSNLVETTEVLPPKVETIIEDVVDLETKEPIVETTEETIVVETLEEITEETPAEVKDEQTEINEQFEETLNTTVNHALDKADQPPSAQSSTQQSAQPSVHTSAQGSDDEAELQDPNTPAVFSLYGYHKDAVQWKRSVKKDTTQVPNVSIADDLNKTEEPHEVFSGLNVGAKLETPRVETPTDNQPEATTVEYDDSTFFTPSQKSVEEEDKKDSNYVPPIATIENNEEEQVKETPAEVKVEAEQKQEETTEAHDETPIAVEAVETKEETPTVVETHDEDTKEEETTKVVEETKDETPAIVETAAETPPPQDTEVQDLKNVLTENNQE
jgi:hypothetical protein